MVLSSKVEGDLMIVLHVFSNTSSSFTKMTENLSGLLVERETSLLSLALSDTSCSMRWYGTFSELIRIHLPHIIVFNPRQLDRRKRTKSFSSYLKIIISY